MAKKRATLSHEATKRKPPYYFIRMFFFVFFVPPCENLLVTDPSIIDIKTVRYSAGS